MKDLGLFIQNHWQLSLALFVVLFLLMILELISQKRGGIHLSPQQVVQLINHANAIVLDIRNSASFATGHIIDAISIPVEEIENKLKKLEKFKSKLVIVVCQSGVESTRATTVLTKHGFDVRVLSGGVQAWKEADMPLVKEQK